MTTVNGTANGSANGKHNGAEALSKVNGNGSNGNGWIAGKSAQIHDDMNLIVLLVMSVVAAWAMITSNSAAQYRLTIFSVGYMVLDGIWIATNMHSVKSPKAVLGHHIATIMVLTDPLMQPQHAFYTCCALLVEANTFLLIVRRRLKWGDSWAVEIPFAVSWIVLRLIWYPSLGVYMLMCAFPSLIPLYPTSLVQVRSKIEGVGSESPMYMASYFAWVGICLFQFWWSNALLNTYRRKWAQGSTTKSSKYL